MQNMGSEIAHVGTCRFQIDNFNVVGRPECVGDTEVGTDT
jgi:hypothetical protein